MFTVFESKERRAKDAMEVRHIFQRYGDNALDVLKQRSKDGSLQHKDRMHWKRLAKKAKAQRHEYLGEVSSQSRANA